MKKLLFIALIGLMSFQVNATSVFAPQVDEDVGFVITDDIQVADELVITISEDFVLNYNSEAKTIFTENVEISKNTTPDLLIFTEPPNFGNYVSFDGSNKDKKVYRKPNISNYPYIYAIKDKQLFSAGGMPFRR